ncbi:hypothetical protein [Streptomyces sp. NPDC003710]
MRGDSPGHRLTPPASGVERGQAPKPLPAPLATGVRRERKAKNHSPGGRFDVSISHPESSSKNKRGPTRALSCFSATAPFFFSSATLKTLLLAYFSRVDPARSLMQQVTWFFQSYMLHQL